MSIVVGSIPSPSNNQLHLGPLSIHVYGILIAIGVIVAVWLSERRWARAGHDPRVLNRIEFWTVLAGLVGARLYHVVTDYELYTHHWSNVFAIWDGGLGIWGAVGGGAVAVIVLARRAHIDPVTVTDAMAPGIVLAQAIGRWGNWFNQELFGRPTSLPWGLQISPPHRPLGYAQYATFHPTFLYESLWCLAIFGILLWAERRSPRRRGQTTALYIALYTFGRFWFENVRIDYAHTILGLRINAWLSLAICIAAIVWLITLKRPSRDTSTTAPETEPSERTHIPDQ